MSNYDTLFEGDAYEVTLNPRKGDVVIVKADGEQWTIDSDEVRLGFRGGEDE